MPTFVILFQIEVICWSNTKTPFSIPIVLTLRIFLSLGLSSGIYGKCYIF